MNALEDDSLASVYDDRKLYVTEESFCYSFIAVDGKVIKTEEVSLRSNHEEADTRMMAHCATLDGPANVVTRSTDSDDLAIALSNCHKLKDGIQLYMEAGVASDNSLRYIDINKIVKRLGPKLSPAIAAFAIYLGIDQNPSWARIGNKGPYGVLEKNVEYQDAFSAMGSSEFIREETLDSLEKFTCAIYPRRGQRVAQNEVNEARLFAFVKQFKPTKKNTLAGIKGIDGSYLTPCYSVFLQQVKRTNLIASVWNNATDLETGNFRIHVIFIYSSLSFLIYILLLE